MLLEVARGSNSISWLSFRRTTACKKQYNHDVVLVAGLQWFIVPPELSRPRLVSLPLHGAHDRTALLETGGTEVEVVTHQALETDALNQAAAMIALVP